MNTYCVAKLTYIYPCLLDHAPLRALRTISIYPDTKESPFLIGSPESPRILSNLSEITARNATVKWTKPLDKRCSITMYSIHYTVIEPVKEKSREINITDASATSYELHLQYSKTYRVVVFAWNDLGRSLESNTWQVKTAQGRRNG